MFIELLVVYYLTYSSQTQGGRKERSTRYTIGPAPLGIEPNTTIQVIYHSTGSAGPPSKTRPVATYRSQRIQKLEQNLPYVSECSLRVTASFILSTDS